MIGAAFVENERRATRGGAGRNSRALSAVRTAISASSTALGSGFTPQSANTSSPPSPRSARAVSISMNEEIRATPARTPTPRRAARRVAAVVERPRHHPVPASGGDAEGGPEQRVLQVRARLVRGDAAMADAIEVGAQGLVSSRSPGGSASSTAPRSVPVSRAAARISSRRPRSVTRAMPPRVAGTAACIVRGSVPSGRTMWRLPRVRARECARSRPWDFERYHKHRGRRTHERLWSSFVSIWTIRTRRARARRHSVASVVSRMRSTSTIAAHSIAEPRAML